MAGHRVESGSISCRLADLSLAFRLVRGSGPVDAVRVLMMAAGLGLSVAALLLAVTFPRALGASSARETSRIPVLSDRSPHTTPFSVDTSVTFVGERQWTRVQLGGGDERSPLPPGLRRLPDPGHSVVSPALKDLLARDGTKRVGLGVIHEAPMEDGGLARPDELVSYTRTASGPRAPTGVSHPSRGQRTAVSGARAGPLPRAGLRSRW